MTPAERAALIARIRKCLALAKSANEHEAAAALGKARALMDEHGLGEGDVTFGQAEARGNGCLHSPPQWEATLIDAVERAMRCKAILAAGRWKFVARAPSADLAAYAFTVLHRQLKRARADYIASHLRRVRPGRRTKRADVFCEGWASTVERKVRALHPGEGIDQALTEYVNATFNLVTVEPRDAFAGLDKRSISNDYWNGITRGRDADLHRPINGGEAAMQLQ